MKRLEESATGWNLRELVEFGIFSERWYVMSGIIPRMLKYRVEEFDNDRDDMDGMIVLNM